MIALTNDERSQNSIGGLTENSLLDAAAQAKAADMAAKGYFAHVGPDGKEPWAWITGAGYDYQYAGENLAVRFTDSSDVVNAWMASPTHRANIVKPQYTEIGVGVAQGTFQGQPATYVVQYFGAPRASAVAAATPIPAPVHASSSAASPALASQTAPTPQVEGAATSAPSQDSGQPALIAQAEPTSVTSASEQPQPPFSQVARELLRSDTEPSSMVLWVLGAVVSLLVVGLALTFFVHIQIQPTEMLISGAVVAVIALSFIALNAQTPFAQKQDQAAAAFGALPSQGGFIDSVAAGASQ